MAFAETCLYNIRRSTPLLPIRHLFRQNLPELVFGHAGPCQDSLALQEERGGDDQNRRAAPVTAGFIEQRHISNDDRHMTAGTSSREAALVSGDQRMQQTLQAAQCRRVAEDMTAQRLAIDA